MAKFNSAWLRRKKQFRSLTGVEVSERYRYPRPAYAAKFTIIAGVLNIAAGF